MSELDEWDWNWDWGITRFEHPPMKGQSVRLLDVFVLGPAMMIAGGYAYRKGYNVSGGITFAGGFATIVYNAVNYGRVKERRALAAHYGVDVSAFPQAFPGYGAPATPMTL